MARGWESKGVEEQRAERENGAELLRSATVDNARAHAETQRARNDLLLQREAVLNERTSNPHRRASLAAALAHIEERLARLGDG